MAHVDVLRQKDLLTSSIAIIGVVIALFGVIKAIFPSPSRELELSLAILMMAVLPFAVVGITLALSSLIRAEALQRLSQYFYITGWCLLCLGLVSTGYVLLNPSVEFILILVPYIEFIVIVIVAIYFVIHSMLLPRMMRKYVISYETKKIVEANRAFQKVWSTNVDLTTKLTMISEIFRSFSIYEALRMIYLELGYHAIYKIDGNVHHKIMFKMVNISNKPLSTTLVYMWGVEPIERTEMNLKASFTSGLDLAVTVDVDTPTYKKFRILFPKKIESLEPVEYEIEYDWPYPKPLKGHRWYEIPIRSPTVDLYATIQIPEGFQIFNQKCYSHGPFGKVEFKESPLMLDKQTIRWSIKFPQLGRTYPIEFDIS